MANSSLSNTNPLVPIGIIGAVVAAVMIGVFAVADDGPPDEPTVIAEDVDGEPAGAGTMAEGEADMEEEGVTEELDEVEPAAGGEIPAQENIDTEGSDEASTESDSEASDSEAADAQGNETEERVTEEGATTTEASEAGGADGEQPVGADAAEQDGAASEEDDSFLIDESSDNPTPADENTESSTENAEALPEGRDAETELNPEDCQDIVRDTDDGGAAVVPTPSGPNGNIGDCVESAQ
ncbi:hypothetical protein PARPLA_00480 [Rhodobacteraceae bacterium THAF1]|uniref:hypothetical protein n=1 Tax=Palleronia sp. THAF1 TaxID=2587842 RepID=UPI000F3AD73E|nr:hypothetical protein [Palleronia sp. THAF1]QFU09957.1 hypothetical protein FIU81_14860 [Palleronia sp. THAF1]VDC17138.1 hypothetical protein PARPLA_00480 [Rhodobacteraceae bacterium THAF1]